MGMTPFEVRLEVLKMAKDLAMEKHFDKRSMQSQHATWNEEHGTTAMVDDIQVPSAADIIQQAEELNKFVSEAPTSNKREFLKE